MDKYSVDNFDSDPDEREYPLDLPSTSRILIAGPSGSGKSIIANNLILKLLKWDKIYMISKTIDQPKQKKLIEKLEELQTKIRKESADPDYKLVFASNQLKDLPKVDDLNKHFRHLIVIDDMITEKNQKEVIDVFVRGRHKNISVIYISQLYFKTPREIRLNCNVFVITNVANQKEIALLNQELATDLSKEEFKAVYNAATAGQYDFLLIDTTQKKLPLKYRRKFNGVLADLNKD